MRQKSKRTTLKDVAEACGVSIASVSSILNNKASNYCSAETKQKVLDTAKSLNYKQHFGYKLMLGESTRTVAVIPSMERMVHEEHIKDLIFKLSNTFNQQNYSCYSSIFQATESENIDIIENLVNRGCEGFVIIGDPMGYEKIEEFCQKRDIKLLSLLSKHAKRCISVSTKNAFKAFFKHFVDHGQNNFKLIAEIDHVNQRLEALQEFFPDQQLEQLIEKYVIPLPEDNSRQWTADSAENRIREGYQATVSLMGKHPDCRAIAYHSDYTFLGGVRCLLEHNLTPGKDIMISGFNNILPVRGETFNISTGSHRISELAQLAIKHLYETGDLNIALEPEIILK